VADSVEETLREKQVPLPQTDYVKSKLFAELSILNTELQLREKVYILRLSIIHSPGNK
jgi:hypothetical protein